MNLDSSLLTLAILRLLLAYLPFGSYIKNDHLLSSPLTSLSRLQEGLYLFSQSIDPYSGGVSRHSPLLLAVFSTILPLTPVTAPLIWTISDTLGAWCLAQIWMYRNIGSSYHDRKTLVIIAYLFNPYLALPGLAQSTSSLENTLLLMSILLACRGKKSLCLLSLAFVTHISLTPGLLLLPLSLLLLTGARPSLNAPIQITGWIRVLPMTLEFITYIAILMLISTIIAGSFSWLEPTWGAVIFLPDLTPNPGLWWYFFTEMFDHFRPFFLVAFSANMLIYIAPICIKFQHDPLYATFILVGILAMFKPYPTLADSGLFLSMMSIFPETFQYLNNAIVTALLHLHASLLLPLFNRLWLSQGTGNANFFYASTLVFGLANGFAITDAIWAGMRAAFGKEQNDWSLVQVYKEKKALNEPINGEAIEI